MKMGLGASSWFDGALTGCGPRALLFLLLLTELLGNVGADAREWEFQGFTITESTPVFERTAISTAREPNPNNQGQLATTHNTLDYMSTMVEPQVVVALVSWRARQFGLDAAALYSQGFGWWDKAQFLDSALNRVNQSAPSFERYSGDGWSLNSFGTKELLAEVMDAYLDFRKEFGSVSIGLRLGKQRQENGNAVHK